MDNTALEMETARNYARYLEAALREERARNARLRNSGAEESAGGDTSRTVNLSPDLSTTNHARPHRSIIGVASNTAIFNDHPPPPIAPVTMTTAALNVRPPLGITRDAPTDALTSNHQASQRNTRGAETTDDSHPTRAQILTGGPSRITKHHPPQSNTRITTNISSKVGCSSEDKSGSITALTRDRPAQHQGHHHSPTTGLKEDQREDDEEAGDDGQVPILEPLEDDDEAGDDGQVPILEPLEDDEEADDDEEVPMLEQREYEDDDDDDDDGEVPILEDHERKPMEQLLTEARMMESLIQEKHNTLQVLEKDTKQKKADWKGQLSALKKAKKRQDSRRRILKGLRAHIDIQRGIRPLMAQKKGGFVCPQCPVSFDRDLCLQQHVKSAHAAGKAKVACPQCGRVMPVYPNNSNLSRHINRFHRRKY